MLNLAFYAYHLTGAHELMVYAAAEHMLAPGSTDTPSYLAVVAALPTNARPPGATVALAVDGCVGHTAHRSSIRPTPRLKCHERTNCDFSRCFTLLFIDEVTIGRGSRGPRRAALGGPFFLPAATLPGLPWP